MKNKYLSLFVTFFKIGLFTFGGGYAMIPLIHKEMVEKKEYIDDDTMTDIIAISESTPGPIAINSATFIGYKVKGVLGSICATLGVVLPSFIIIFIISLFLNNLFQYEIIQNAFIGIKACVTLLIFNAFLKITKSVKKNFLSYLLLISSLLVALLTNINSILMIIAGGLIYLIYYSIKKVDDIK